MKKNSLSKTYIEIDTKPYSENIVSFSFKINKRGGEGGKILLAKDESFINVNDNVVLYIEGEKKYSGFIEKIAKNGKEIYVAPAWARLRTKYILGTLNLTNEVSIKSIVLKLKDIICETGICFSETNINIPEEYKIEISISGRNVADILDDCEKALPEGYVWNVDGSLIFSFSLIDTKPKKTIGQDTLCYSESESETDYGDIYSECIVKVKDSSIEENGLRTIGIVGNGSFSFREHSFFYPKLPVYDIVGSKTKVKEFDIEIDTGLYESVKSILDSAYNELIYQSIPIKLKVKNINTEEYSPSILECINVKNSQEEGISSDVIGGDEKVESTPALNFYDGQVSEIGMALGGSSDVKEIYNWLTLRRSQKWINFCNHTRNITNIAIRYNSENNMILFLAHDGILSKIIKGYAGFVNIDISNMEKRNIQIRPMTEDRMFIYKRVTAYADIGTKTYTLITKIIDYNYSQGSLSINAEYSNINTMNSSIIFNQNKRLREIEKLLSVNI